ncbi:related to Na+-transporting ATPase ENA-1 [Cephalotrichum gorgonifer]|uniref:P-type Na(+) transporter n=1 Tax=Cephalotrichum gorgonifer TaxID=2041049 RepID=A0AAE8N4E4_9PEZI|nr:related to Na+-transporting ATPase ENA-1 [Cephalotrichum gorgonifer]
MGETTATWNGPSLDSPEGTTDLDEPPLGGLRAPPTPTPIPHSIKPTDLAGILGTHVVNGLSAAEAAARLERDGPNKVEAAKGTSAWQIFLRQISNSLTLVLVIVMVLSFCIQDYIEASVVAAVILFNIVVGFQQDYKAESQMQQLLSLASPTCHVIRDGQVQEVKSEVVVVGDLMKVSVGDIVAADARLVEGINLSAEEANLTGESVPISKHADRVLDAEDIPLGDRINMVYSSTAITRGRATAIVTSIGMDTEVGKIASMLRTKKTVSADTPRSVRVRVWLRSKIRSILGFDGTPLQNKLSAFALVLFALAILLVLIVFATAKFDVQGQILLYGICVGVAVIPESLIAVLTLTFTVAARAMSRGNVIVRNKAALQAVGGVTNICSDKTGTLTQGRMVMRKVWTPDDTSVSVVGTTDPFNPFSGKVVCNNTTAKSSSRSTPTVEKADDGFESSLLFNSFLDAISLCNNATVSDDSKNAVTDDSASVTTAALSTTWVAVGEPTEIALQVFATRFSRGKPELIRTARYGRLETEFPFDSSCKRMSVIYESPSGGDRRMFTKGAPEAILPLLDSSDHIKSLIVEKADEMASEGYRVLCVAQKTIATGQSTKEREATECKLEFLGLAGLYDPPRLETAGAVRQCKEAGVSVHMVTGDHIKTATSIALEVGILTRDMSSSELENAVMQASDFDKLEDAEIDAMKSLPLVIGRCSPMTKVRMIEAMHRRKAFCVMTGDGVNDSPALKQADIGIAMGLRGSDVAKEASDMVLTDDNFASIVTAIKEGRRLFDNVQKFLLHLLISNIAQVILLLIGLAFKDEEGTSVFPLSPLEILWANLITSSFLAVGLGMEEAQPDLLTRPPANSRSGVFTVDLIRDKMIYGFFMGALCLASFTSIAYGVAGPGHLGLGCNDEYNDSCDVVFRARSTTYATLSFLLLVTAWEAKHFTRSLFAMNPELWTGPTSFFRTVWHNRTLFWAVTAGFLFTFPVIYIPVVNRVVFKHEGITWEWGIVVGCVAAYLALVESWKAVKRRFGLGTHKAARLSDV